MRRSGWLRVEASVLVLAARIAVAVLPHPRLVQVLERPVRRREPAGRHRDDLRDEVALAVRWTVDRVPGAVCLPRAIAAQAMLRRRGIATTLHFGVPAASSADRALHAWLTDGAIGITGARTSAAYRSVVSYGSPRGPAPM